MTMTKPMNGYKIPLEAKLTILGGEYRWCHCVCECGFEKAGLSALHDVHPSYKLNGVIIKVQYQQCIGTGNCTTLMKNQRWDWLLEDATTDIYETE